MSVTPVCRVGDPLQLTCTASDSEEFVRWSILLANEHGTLTKIATTSCANQLERCISNESKLIEVTVASAIFIFVRTFVQLASPLVSIIIHYLLTQLL